jgi:phospholipid/cholesterol/gamma-HCH transport system substrate-binding protein
MNEIKVGLMALATMATVVYMSLKVTSNQSGFGDYITYRTIVRDASGIFPKTPIKVAGISAGRIKKIELADNNALITFEVLENVKIAKDSKLRIKTVGFLGDKYLEIVVGKNAERLEGMALMPAEAGGGMENLVKDASQVLKDVKVIVSTIKDSLAPADQEPPLKKMINDMQTLVDNTKEATKSLKNILSGNEEKLHELIANLQKFSEDLSAQVDSTNEESAMADLKKILSNAKTMTADMKDLVADIKAGKGTVGKLLVEEEIADEVQATLAGVKKLVGKVDQIRTELSMFTGVNTDYGGETDVALRIFPSPERFYVLGLTTSEFGPENEQHTTTIVNGVSSTEVRTTKKKDSYRFNVQVGRKIQSWVFRGGIIESSGGLGLDYEFSDWGSKVTAEVFDYRDGIGPNIRLAAEIQLWNVLYGKLAGEDLVEETRSATISGGLKFTDEDLKGLIGFFF